MRTTVVLDDDVAAAIRRLRPAGSRGQSKVINDLIREGLTVRRPRVPFVQRTDKVGMLIDVTNVAEALELLEGPYAR